MIWVNEFYELAMHYNVWSHLEKTIKDGAGLFFNALSDEYLFIKKYVTTQAGEMIGGK
jgi:hypothetical protein